MKSKARFFSLIVFVFFIQTVLVSSAWAATKIMPLGDSITYDNHSGDTRPEGERIAYRYRLWQLLNDEDYDFDFVGSQYAGYDIFPDADNEGWPGYRADEIRDEVFDWLQLSPADIVLLHIGTNDISTSQSVAGIVDEVEEILTDIFQYSSEITVILAKIINRKTFSQKTNDFNNLLPIMVNAHPNKGEIIIVDMEVGAGIDYATDMFDDLHPNTTGYSKMANVWFSALQEILPAADAGSDQSVDEGNTVTLDGSRSNNPGFNPISSYFWEQTGGKPVTISDPAVVQPTFTAPDAGSQGEMLTFRLTVTYSDSFESTDANTVMVNGHSSSSSSGGGCFIGTITE